MTGFFFTSTSGGAGDKNQVWMRLVETDQLSKKERKIKNINLRNLSHERHRRDLGTPSQSSSSPPHLEPQTPL